MARVPVELETVLVQNQADSGTVAQHPRFTRAEVALAGDVLLTVGHQLVEQVLANLTIGRTRTCSSASETGIIS